MSPASATSEAIEAEVLVKVWDVLLLRAVGVGGRRAQRAVVGVGGRSERRWGQRRSELTIGGHAVAAEGSRLRVGTYLANMHAPIRRYAPSVLRASVYHNIKTNFLPLLCHTYSNEVLQF